MSIFSARRAPDRSGVADGVAILFAALCLSLLAPAAALAHAGLVESTPADGTTVEGTPAVIELRFSEPLNTKSSIELVGPAGSVASGVPGVDQPTTMRLTPPALDPGLYSVRWTAATDDGHIERGAISFAVIEPAPTPSPSPAPTASLAPGTPSAAPSATAPAPSAELPTPSPAPGDADDSQGIDPAVLLAIAAVAVIVGGASLFLLRGRTSR